MRSHLLACVCVRGGKAILFSTACCGGACLLVLVRACVLSCVARVSFGACSMVLPKVFYVPFADS